MGSFAMAAAVLLLLMLLGFSLCPLKKNKRENAEFNHKFLYAPDNNAVIWRAESLFI